MLDAIRSRGEARLFTSPALLDELADVLTRPSATKRLAIIGRTVGEVLADYVEAMEVVEPEHVPAWCPTMPTTIRSSPQPSRRVPIGSCRAMPIS
ncbi:MAG TPA: hypothetical protein PK752_24510 [Accumulibacter sp.]|uniref:hypothetical protein n=1 Tax=Accumulibacter sp. TaxID=2053492 RepID=UPI002CE649BE|nr:hypothetical protein [Accumulibacter sp.]HRD91392.1 hypothetical protein [Accumulibacter sp.]